MMYLFWDITNDEPEILGDDGEFYFYSEDAVAINNEDYAGRSWTKLNKMQDITPLNEYDRFLFYSESVSDWIPWGTATFDEIRAVHIAANDPDAGDRA